MHGSETSALGYSGAILVDTAPGLPSAGGAGGDTANSDPVPNSPDFGAFNTILSGSHTMRYWYGGADRQRVAILRPTSEADYFRNGEDVWEWDSASHQVSRTKATGEDWNLPLTFASLTPQELARNALDAVDAQTTVTVGAPVMVASRRCYELVVTRPQDVTSPIGQMRIAVDGENKVPLSVQIFARNGTSPAIDVSFSSITFKTPEATYFSFTPPAGATWVPWAQAPAAPS